MLIVVNLCIIMSRKNWCNFCCCWNELIIPGLRHCEMYNNPVKGSKSFFCFFLCKMFSIKTECKEENEICNKNEYWVRRMRQLSKLKYFFVKDKKEEIKKILKMFNWETLIVIPVSNQIYHFLLVINRISFYENENFWITNSVWISNIFVWYCTKSVKRSDI